MTNVNDMLNEIEKQQKKKNDVEGLYIEFSCLQLLSKEKLY